MNDRTTNDAGPGGAARQPSRPKPPAAPAGASPGRDLYGATQADAAPSRATRTGGGAGRPAREAYEVVRLLGEGGMGSVYLAHDIHLGRWVALKRLSKEFVSNPRLLERFRVEGRSVAALNHFHIVSVFAMAEDDDGPYIAMEYVGGPAERRLPDWRGADGAPPPPLNLEEFVQRSGPMPIEQALALLRKLCSAVEYAHQRKVIHRDIKPANILLDEQGEPKLTDFGLARQLEGDRKDKTLIGASIGSRGYMAPEQEINAAAVDHRADVYALGGTLWFLLTGQNPAYFRESEVPAALRPVLVKALAKDRERRFASAAEFERALGSPPPATAPVAGTAVVPGACAKCGHVHFSDPQRGFARTLCEMCRASLFEPCLKCGAGNGVWARFCNCGADLAVTLEAVRARLASEPAAVAVLRKEARYEEAIRRLQAFESYKHSGLKQWVEWAREECEATKGAFARARTDALVWVSRAAEFIAAHDDAEAIRVLEAIPPLLRSDEAKELLARASARLAEVEELDRRIRRKLVDRQYDGLRDLAARFLKLRPGHPDVLNVKEKAKRYEAEQEESCWRDALADNTAKAYRRYLKDYPGGTHEEEARDNLADCVRQLLLWSPKDEELRGEYLKHRPKKLREADTHRALQGVLITSAVVSGVVGLALGLLCGVCSQSAGLAFLCLVVSLGIGTGVGLGNGSHKEKGRRFGPLPWLDYMKSPKTLRHHYLEEE